MPIQTKDTQRSRRVNDILIREEARHNIASRLAADIGNSSFLLERDAAEMGTIGASALIAELDSSDLGRAIRFGHGHGSPITTIDGLPVSRELPPTPRGFGDDSAVQVQDCLLLGAIEMIGGHPIAYEYENFGRLIRNVAPVSRHSTAASSHGAKTPLGWHTDNPWPFESKFLDRSPCPRFLCFFGMRVNDGNGNPVPTEVLPVVDVLERCSKNLIERLMKPEFRVNPPESNDCDALVKTALLEPDRDGQPAFLRFNNGDGQIDGMTASACDAIAELSDVLADSDDVVIEIDVNPGTVLMFDNYRVLHRRRSFVPGDDMDAARWLRRCFACRNPDTGRFVDRRHRPFVWK